MSDTLKNVRVLGAGFSRALNGPLLRDLFRSEPLEDIAPFFSLTDFPDLANHLVFVQKLFSDGVQDHFWENAEQFLAYVDDHSRRAAPRRRKSSPISSRRSMRRADRDTTNQTHILRRLNRITRRALAAECSRFLIGAEPDESEAWLPYREWAKSLVSGRDTVITFNYDLVIETVTHKYDPQHDNHDNRIWIALPGQRQPDEVVPVLKLHGSVPEWAVLRETIVRDDGSQGKRDSLEGLRSPETHIAIAAPGASKAEFVAQHLEPLWGLAERALAEAGRVFFVGYSFPDTDPGPQIRILNALGSDTSDVAFRRADIVLGRDTGSDIGRRMLELVRSAPGKRQVFHDRESPGVSALSIDQARCGAQDFIGRWEQIVASPPMQR